MQLLKGFGNFRVLRSAVIYGANGSGKSNFISALSFMRDLVSNGINHQPGQGVFQARHKLSAEETPSIKVKLEKIKLADLPQELQLPDASIGLPAVFLMCVDFVAMNLLLKR